MNRHSPSQTTPPYTNGHYETPQDVSGVSLHRPPPARQPTVFPTALPLRGLGPWLYGLHRFQLGGLPVSRYVAAFWLLMAGLALLDIVPGGWFTVAVVLLLWIGQIVLGVRHQRQHYVSFSAAPLPALNDVPLDPTEKLPIYATGLLGVEGRIQQYSMLPGFYRTFATGEHAVLCQVQERTWLGILRWPPDEIGMWYAFVHPLDIQRLTWGNLHFGRVSHPALAVEYRLEIPPGPRRKHPEIRRETLYLATAEPQMTVRLYVDLLANLSSDQVVAAQSAY